MSEKAKILIVDDRSENLLLLERILDGLEVEFVRACSGEEALESLVDCDFALTLIDVRMPEMDGYELVKHLRDRGQTENLPVIFISDIDREDIDKIRGMDAGAVDFVAKPIIPEILRGKVRIFLKIFRQRSKLIRQKEEIQRYSNDLYRSMMEARHASDKLTEAMDTKSEFISTVSHELRTPLTAIKEGIAIVLDGSAGEVNDEQKEFLGIAKRNVDRLARLINDVLDFQKLAVGKMRFDMQEVDINSLVREVYDTMVSTANNLGVDLLLDLDADSCKVSLDHDRITQVIGNLVSNALKFTTEGNVTIGTTENNGCLEVFVSDTGCGIREEDIVRVFHEFEQLAVGNERKVGGTGLGLAISKKIVEEHGGSISVESEHGVGSRFYFELPLSREQMEPVVSSETGSVNNG